MHPVTVRFDDDTIQWLDDEVDRRDLDSRAELLRELLDEARNAETLRSENEQLRARIEEMRNRLAAANSQHDDVGELVEYVREERSLQERREEREAHRDRIRSASAPKRAWWWLVGPPEPPTATD